MVIRNVSTSVVIGCVSTCKYHGSMVIGNTLWQHSLTALNPRRKILVNGNLWMCRVFLCCSWLIYYSSTSEAAALLFLPGFHMVRWDDIWRSQCCLKLGRLCSPVFYNPVTSVPFCLAVWAITNLSGQHIFAFCCAGCSVFFLDTTNQKVFCPLAPFLIRRNDSWCGVNRSCDNACCMIGFCLPYALSAA